MNKLNHNKPVLEQTNEKSVEQKNGSRKTKLSILITALVITFSASANDNYNDIGAYWYLDSLKTLSSDIDSKSFLETRRKTEKTLAIDSLSDAQVQEIFFWLYDLKKKYKDNEKIIKIINKLMEKYDILFDKYDWYDEVRDKLLMLLEEKSDITKDEYTRIEAFSDKPTELKLLYDNNKNIQCANWSELLVEELQDNDWWERKLQDEILEWIKKLINDKAENGLTWQELNDFKTVLWYMWVMSNLLKDLDINTYYTIPEDYNK